MKTLIRIMILPAVLIAALLSGCSTPASRIRENPELFAQIPPAQQDLIRQGAVALGFTAEMVRLALGEPDRFAERTGSDSPSEVWSYVTYDAPDGMPLYRGWYHRYYYWGDPMYPYYLSYPHRRERERFSVVFRGGKVVELEKETRR
jgi:hypothetical protein